MPEQLWNRKRMTYQASKAERFVDRSMESFFISTFSKRNSGHEGNRFSFILLLNMWNLLDDLILHYSSCPWLSWFIHYSNFISGLHHFGEMPLPELAGFPLSWCSVVSNSFPPHPSRMSCGLGGSWRVGSVWGNWRRGWQCGRRGLD